MCFQKLTDLFRSSYQKLYKEREEEEDVQPQLVELPQVRPASVLVTDLLNSLVGQAVLQCKVMRVRDDITEAPSLCLVTEIPDLMRRKLMAMKTQNLSTSGEDMESSTTAIASTSTAPNEAPPRCGMAIYPWGETSIHLTVDGEPKDIDSWFEEQYLDPTVSEGVNGNLLHNVEVEKVLADTQDSDTVAELWHGPMQIHLRWHTRRVIVGRDLNRPQGRLLPDPLRMWDLGLVYIV